MKATKLLETQHRHVEQLFAKLEKGQGDASALLRELEVSLVAHMKIENEIFYPVAKRAKENLILEAYEEHELGAYALARLLATPPSDPSFKARVVACKEIIEHHVEEEENELFPAVERFLGAPENEHLGRRMEVRFAQLESEGVGLPSMDEVTESVAQVADQAHHDMPNQGRGHGGGNQRRGSAGRRPSSRGLPTPPTV